MCKFLNTVVDTKVIRVFGFVPIFFRVFMAWYPPKPPSLDMVNRPESLARFALGEPKSVRVPASPLVPCTRNSRLLHATFQAFISHKKQGKISNSINTEIVRKTEYSKNMAAARLFVILHLNIAIEAMTDTSMKNRRNVEQNKPLLSTGFGWNEFTALHMNQGIGSLKTKIKPWIS